MTMLTLQTTLVGDPTAGETQEAELENEAEQENEAKISQLAIAGQKCEGVAVFCANEQLTMQR